MVVTWPELHDALIARVEAAGPTDIHKATTWPRVDAESAHQAELAYGLLMRGSDPADVDDCDGVWVESEWELTWRRNSTDDERVAAFRQMLEDGQRLAEALTDETWRRSIDVLSVSVDSFEPPVEREGGGRLEGVLVLLVQHRIA